MKTYIYDEPKTVVGAYVSIAGIVILGATITGYAVVHGLTTLAWTAGNRAYRWGRKWVDEFKPGREFP
jgi:hypothetical protein